MIRGSVLDESAVSEAVSGCHAVFHEAARVTIRGSTDQFVEDAETNLHGTLKLLRTAGKARVKRFLYASSMAVYSDSETPAPVPETHPTQPISPYGIAKLAAERYVLLTGKNLGLEPVVFRYFNTFGTRQAFTPYVGVITIFATLLLRGQDITIFGDGSQTRDFVHVSDIVQANMLGLSENSAVGRIFNVGTGQGTTVLQLGNLLREKISPGSKILYAPAREEELRNSVADIAEARDVLGYQPRTDLASQLPEIIQTIQNRK